jgi:hypothetical protein
MVGRRPPDTGSYITPSPCNDVCCGLFESFCKGSIDTLLADGAIRKIWGVNGHQPNPPLIIPTSSSYGRLPALAAVLHHMHVMGSALSKMAVDARIGGGCVGVVYGGFL